MRALVWLAALACLPALAATPEGREFLAIARQLEPVHCEKRKLRREIAVAEVERRHAAAQAVRARFDALSRKPETARLERRLAQLERRLSDGKGGVRDAEDLRAISLQQRQAFYRCE